MKKLTYIQCTHLGFPMHAARPEMLPTAIAALVTPPPPPGVNAAGRAPARVGALQSAGGTAAAAVVCAAEMGLLRVPNLVQIEVEACGVVNSLIVLNLITNSILIKIIMYY